MSYPTIDKDSSPYYSILTAQKKIAPPLAIIYARLHTVRLETTVSIDHQKQSCYCNNKQSSCMHAADKFVIQGKPVADVTINQNKKLHKLIHTKNCMVICITGV